MNAVLPVEEYRALLTLSTDSPLWTWHHEVVDPRTMAAWAQRIPELTRYTYQDQKVRPLAIFLARLFFELGVFTHAKRGHEWAVRPEFLDASGRVRVAFSIQTPWGMHELSPGAVNDFLAHAVSVGDGMPQEIGHTSAGAPIGLRIDRALDLLLDEHGGGRLAMQPLEGAADDLIYAFSLGAELRIVNCGKPRFSAVDEAVLQANGWMEVHAPMPSFAFPRTFMFQDPLSPREERFFVPGTEKGGQFRLSGAAFIGSGEDYYPVSAALGDNGPIIRAHFEYLPGWLAPMVGTRREWPWSLLPEDYQNELISRFSVIREL